MNEPRLAGFFDSSASGAAGCSCCFGGGDGGALGGGGAGSGPSAASGAFRGGGGGFGEGDLDLGEGFATSSLCWYMLFLAWTKLIFFGCWAAGAKAEGSWACGGGGGGGFPLDAVDALFGLCCGGGGGGASLLEMGLR